jgi:tripartite-type tricarboxylate transporter receptor subunit TctC
MRARLWTNAGVSGVAFATLSALCGTAHAQTSFDGKTIRVVIASTASGPTDVVGRQFAPFISKHTPGKPTIVVENRPGAAGAVAANYMYNVASPDGLTIGLMFGMVTQGLMQNDGIKFDPAQFAILGAVSATQVLLARNDLGLKTPRDLLKPATPLVLAGLGSGSTADAGNRLFLDLIGATYKYVGGYPGQAEAILSVARGETNLANATHSAYLSRRDTIKQEGIYDAFLQRGELTAGGSFKRNVQLPEMKTTIEAIEEVAPAALKSGDFSAYRSIIGALAVHYSFVLPPKTPQAIVDTLRKALTAGAEDPEARRIIQASLRSDYEYVDGPSSQKIVQKLREEYNADPRIGQRLKQIMSVK